MRGDENKNIDVPSKVKAFRKDFPPDKAAIWTGFEFVEIAGVPAVVGRAVVTDLTKDTMLSEAHATRGLRAPIAGAQGMKDTRDAERAMTGAVGRALFLMGYGERPDDSVDYEPEEQIDWFVANGWRDQAHHDSFRDDAKLAVSEMGEPFRQQAIDEWHRRELKWPLTHDQFEEWTKFLVPLGREAQVAAEVKAGAAGDEAGGEPAAQPSLDGVGAVGPDVPLTVKH